jgi:hypothetical protein
MNAVTWVMAKTETRSEKSSSGVTACPSPMGTNRARRRRPDGAGPGWRARRRRPDP